MNVMREAVEERAGEPLRAEYARPLVERQIARDQRAASLVALAEDLEQQLGPSRRKRHVAEFIDDQQPVASELTLEPQEPFLVTRLEQFVDESRRRDEADRQALLAGRQSEPERDVALARPAVADGDDVLAPLDVVRARQLQHHILFNDGRARKSKLSRLLTVGNRAALIRRSTMRRSRSIISISANRIR